MDFHEVLVASVKAILTLAVKFLPDRTIEVTVDEASGLIRNGKLVGTPR